GLHPPRGRRQVPVLRRRRVRHGHRRSRGGGSQVPGRPRQPAGEGHEGPHRPVAAGRQGPPGPGRRAGRLSRSAGALPGRAEKGAGAAPRLGSLVLRGILSPGRHGTGPRGHGTLIRGSAAALTARTVREIAPAVSEEMARWRRAALSIADPFLKSQALASQVHKRFHALGGSVYALLAPGRERRLVTLIVALQTISDYLDNLCDRGPCNDLDAYRLLHQAMLDAVEPGTPPAPYYQRYPHRDDGGYLEN